jgi:glycine cleavage system H protein
MSDFKLDANAKYAKTHEWVRIEDGIAVVGISDAAQDMLSDVVFVELPEVGSQISAGDQVAVVESVKAAEDVNAPISGEVVEVNSDLEDEPEEVNTDPYGAWFFKVKPGDDLDAELAALMTSEEYDAFVDEDAH